MSDPYQRDFAAPLQPAHRIRGAAATKRTKEPSPDVDWDAVIKRFRRDMRKRYKGAPKDGFAPQEPNGG